MRVRLKYIALFLLLAASSACATFAILLSSAYTQSGALAVEKRVYIAPGAGGRDIAMKLATEGVIVNTFHFRLLARLRQEAGMLKSGEYAFQPHTSIKDVIALLQSGKTYQRKITIPEGLTSAEIVEIVNRTEAMTGKIETIPEEGSVLPETYSYSYNDTRTDIMKRMQKALQATVSALWKNRSEMIVKTPEEALVLASIVEKETGVPSERARVAGVFLNRLKVNMPLQSDPTVIYALTLGKKKLGRPLSRADLETQSAYNTYATTGLPPAPIANPGKASLEAVLNPEANDYYYFVADGSGGHAFARTLEEHARNVTRWRAWEKTKNKGKE